MHNLGLKPRPPLGGLKGSLGSGYGTSTNLLLTTHPPLGKHPFTSRISIQNVDERQPQSLTLLVNLTITLNVNVTYKVDF